MLFRLLSYILFSVVTCLPLFAQMSDKQSSVEGNDSDYKDLILKINGKIQGASTVFATEGKRLALLVGIADYPSVEGYQMQKLRATVKDVNALAGFLKNPKRGGFDANLVFTLTDEQATRRNILITLNDIARQATPKDMVFIYFSGHGYRPNDRRSTYLIPYDFNMRDVDTTCIDFGDLAVKIREMEASKVVVILDACHAGGVKPVGTRASGNTGIVQRYLEAFEASEGRALLLSSDESEVSWEEEDNGVFTRFFLEGLGGEADTNGDGIVTFTEVALYVEETVPAYTRDRFPQIQRPTRRYELGQVRGDIPLAVNWSHHEVFLQQQQRLLDQRNGTILKAGLAGLDQTLKEFSMKVVQSAHHKAIRGMPLTEKESIILPEIDGLYAGNLTVTDYTTRARAVYNLDAPARPKPFAPEPSVDTDFSNPTGINSTTTPLTSLMPSSQVTPTTRGGGHSPRGVAFTASLLVPGLGQHLQKRPNRGWLHMGLAAGTGIAALWARGRHQSTLDDYTNLQSELLKRRGLTDGEATDLLNKQDDAYDAARSARRLTIVTQALLGIVWGINAIDAGIAEFGQQNHGVAIDARPTTDGGRLVVHMPF